MTEPLYLEVEGFLNPHEAGLLRDLAATAPKGGTIVELGSYRGKSTVALAMGARVSESLVWAIDDHGSYHQGETDFGPQDNVAFLMNIVHNGFADVVRVINLPSLHVAVVWDKPIDLIFLDANHEYEFVKQDFECWQDRVNADGLIAMHDTGGNWPGVTQFVNELLAAGEWEKIAMADATSVFKRVQRDG